MEAEIYRQCGQCSNRTMALQRTEADDVSPTGTPLALDIFQCPECKHEIALRPLASLFIYALMGIMGGWVTLYLFWGSYGDLIQLPEPFFSDLLPEFYTIFDFVMVGLTAVFLASFSYHFMICVSGFLLRWQNPAVEGEKVQHIATLFIASVFGLGAFIGLTWVLTLLELGNENLRMILSSIVITGFLVGARRFGANAPLAVIFAFLWLAFGIWIVS